MAKLKTDMGSSSYFYFWCGMHKVRYQFHSTHFLRAHDKRELPPPVGSLAITPIKEYRKAIHYDNAAYYHDNPA